VYATENVVQILGMTEGPDPSDSSTTRWMMVLEFCDSDVQNMLYKPRDAAYQDYSKPLMLALCGQIAKGLQYVHKMDKTHWDLKPENVLLKRADYGAACRWIAKVADFGSVDCPQDGGSTRDVGTFGYMSPQAHDSERFGAMDKSDDVFSFGVTMWEMLERTTPLDHYGSVLTAQGYGGVPQCRCAEPCQDASKPGSVAFCVRKVTSWMAGDVPELEGHSKRPAFGGDWPAELQQLVQVCWAHEQTHRPSFDQICQWFDKHELHNLAACETLMAAVSDSPAADGAAQTIEQWMTSIGLEDKLDTVEAYLSGAETVADAGFVEFLEASDDYVDEMVDDEELDEDEAETLKGALQKLREQPAGKVHATDEGELYNEFEAGLTIDVDETERLRQEIAQVRWNCALSCA
jgi:hypothetical protein